MADIYVNSEFQAFKDYVEFSAPDLVSIDFKTQITDVFDGGNSFVATLVSASLIELQDSFGRILRFEGSGFGPLTVVGTLDDILKAFVEAIGEFDGSAGGTLNSVTLIDGPTELFRMSVSASEWNFVSGTESLKIEGQLPTSLGQVNLAVDEIFNLATNDLDPDYDPETSSLVGFTVNKITGVSDGVVRGSLTFSSTQVTALLGDYSLILDGTFPDNFGEVGSIILDIVNDLVAERTLPDNVSLTSLSLMHNPTSKLVIGVTGDLNFDALEKALDALPENNVSIGGEGDDTLDFVGSIASVSLSGGAGDDRLYGGSDSDNLSGGGDEDEFVGGRGSDTIDGGSSESGEIEIDTVGYHEEFLFDGGSRGIVANLEALTHEGLSPNQVIDSFGTIDIVFNIEEIYGTGFDDVVYNKDHVGDFGFKGFLGDDTYFGSLSSHDGLDYRDDERFAQVANAKLGLSLSPHGIVVNFSGDVTVGDGASGTIVDSFGDTDTVNNIDFVRGTFFDDVFNGGDDNDGFRGLKGNDIFNGGNGYDFVSYSRDNEGNGVQPGGLTGIVVNFASDVLADNANIGTIIDGFGTTDTLNSIESIAGTDFVDTVRGGADGLEFDGLAGDDKINGGNGSDQLSGGVGADQILGDGAVMRTEGAESIVRLYLATLGRGPDDAGLAGWAAARDAGRSLNSIATGFVTSDEFLGKYGPSLSNNAFVTLLYNNVLHRAPDAGGLGYWVNLLDTGSSRESIVTGFSESPEFAKASDTEWHAGEVYRLYGATLDRVPDAGGLAGWVYDLDNGRSIQDVAQGFVSSAEFVNKYGALDDTAFITLLYNNVLGRAPDAGGLADWLRLLNTGGTRTGVVVGFSDSPEYVNKTTDALISYMQTVQPTWNDVLDGGQGNDNLSGGHGADRFIFDKTVVGIDHIYGIEAWDTIDMRGFGYANEAAAFSHLTASGADVVFTDQGQTITFHQATLAEVQAVDWLIA